MLLLTQPFHIRMVLLRHCKHIHTHLPCHIAVSYECLIFFSFLRVMIIYITTKHLLHVLPAMSVLLVRVEHNIHFNTMYHISMLCSWGKLFIIHTNGFVHTNKSIVTVGRCYAVTTLKIMTIDNDNIQATVKLIKNDCKSS